MNAEEAAVIAAAKTYYRSDGGVDEHNELMDAVRALDDPTFAAYRRKWAAEGRPWNNPDTAA